MNAMRKEMMLHAQDAGLYVATWAPGDGATRYRFFTEPRDYHAGEQIYTALGVAEAMTFVRGFKAGCANVRARGKAAA